MLFRVDSNETSKKIMAGLSTGHYYDGPLIVRIWLPPCGGGNLLYRLLR